MNAPAPPLAVFSLALLLFAGCRASMRTGGEGTRTAEPLRVMSFNIRYHNPGDGVNAWRPFSAHGTDIPVQPRERLLDQLRPRDVVPRTRKTRDMPPPPSSRPTTNASPSAACSWSRSDIARRRRGERENVWVRPAARQRCIPVTVRSAKVPSERDHIGRICTDASARRAASRRHHEKHVNLFFAGQVLGARNRASLAEQIRSIRRICQIRYALVHAWRAAASDAVREFRNSFQTPSPRRPCVHLPRSSSSRPHLLWMLRSHSIRPSLALHRRRSKRAIPSTGTPSSGTASSRRRS